MKITLTAPNRNHHYRYADSLERLGVLYKFLSGFSRLSPRSSIPSVNEKLERHDFYQTLYIASLYFKMPFQLVSALNRLSNNKLDKASYEWAKKSDVFLYYRTQGLNTSLLLKKNNYPTICVMEEVNSHVEFANEILLEEYKKLGLKEKFQCDVDYNMRLKTYESSDFILCPSDFVRRSFLLKGFDFNKLIKVNYGFPPVETEKQDFSNSADETFRVLYVGQINYRKGLRYAIDAFKMVKHPKKEFVIVGPKTSITGLEKTQIPKDVIFTGPLKGVDLKNQFRLASVLILPSLEEGQALVQGEALAFGLPILITTNTGGDDLISDGVEGFIVPPGDINAIKCRLQQMADDRSLVENMSRAALNTARNLGGWDSVCEKLITELLTIMKDKQQHSMSALSI